MEFSFQSIQVFVKLGITLLDTAQKNHESSKNHGYMLKANFKVGSSDMRQQLSF